MQGTLPVTEIAFPAGASAAPVARLRPTLRQTAAWSRSAAGPASFLIRNLALAAGVLDGWRLASDLGWAPGWRSRPL